MNKVASLKQFKNSINLNGKKYFSSSYLMNLGKSFDGAEFVRIGNQVFYSVK
jgi:hypothetical protein